MTAAGRHPRAAGPPIGRPAPRPVARALWLLAAALLCPLWGWAHWLRLRASSGRLTDFAEEWTSARAAIEGGAIYEPLATAIPRYFGGEWTAAHVSYNGHPPASVLAVLPLGALDYPAALLIWNLVSLAALAWAVAWLVGRRGLDLGVWSLPAIAVALVTSNALAQQLNQGQWNLVLLALVVAAWSAARGGRESLAGALVGVAAALKLFPAFLLLPLAARGRWQAVGWGAATFCGLNALAAVVLGWRAVGDYLFEVMPALAVYRDFWMNASLAGFWSKLFAGLSGHVEPLWRAPGVAVLATLASAVAVVWIVWRRAAAAESRAALDRAWALAIVGMLLAAPLTWDHSFLLLLLPLAVVWSDSESGRWQRLTVVASVLGLGFLNPRWIWDATIEGPGELAIGPGLVPSVAQPVEAATVLSLQFYLLVTLFAIAAAPRISKHADADA